MALVTIRNRPSADLVQVRMHLSEPFVGSAAVARGLVTPSELRGPRFRRILAEVCAVVASRAT